MRDPRGRPRISALALACVVALSACRGETPSTATGPPTTPPPVTTSATSTTPTSTWPITARLETTTCETPPGPFTLLCEVYDIVVSEYAGELHDTLLASGAILGLIDYGIGDLTPLGPPLSEEVVTCALPAPDFGHFCDAYLSIRSQYGLLEEAHLVESAVRGMLDFGIEEDPHTRYTTPAIHQIVLEHRSGEFEGIGAFVRLTTAPEVPGHREECPVVTESCVLAIVRPFEGSPAQAAGLAPGDVVLAVNRRPLIGLTMDEIVLEVRGSAGTPIELLIQRENARFEVKITRARLEIPLIETEMLEGDIGYIRLSSFARDSHAQFEDGLEELLAAGARLILFDLQDNAGGFLDEAINVADEFLADGLIVIEEFADGHREEFSASPSGLATNPSLQVVLLVNAGTASGAEIVAGALQDRGRVTVVGEVTFGKGSVQQNYTLGNGGGLAVTIARWLTPNLRSVDGLGVEPDVVATAPEGGPPGFLDVRLRALSWLAQRA